MRPEAASPPHSSVKSGIHDIDLYRHIVARVRRGENYEFAAVHEQRELGYPTKPFWVVRPPLLSKILSLMPKAEIWPFIGYSLIAFWGYLVWSGRFLKLYPLPYPTVALKICLATGLVTVILNSYAAMYFSESLAGFLILLSLGFRTKRHFLVSAVFGLFAALIRELALPYLGIMAMMAVVDLIFATPQTLPWVASLRQGDKRDEPFKDKPGNKDKVIRKHLFWEALTFSLALIIALIFLILHGRAVEALQLPHDRVSPGWIKFGGWHFLLTTINWNLISTLFGLWATAVILPLSLLGLFGWRGSSAMRVGVVIIFYSLAFLVVGRPLENDYWGLITSPLMGLALGYGCFSMADLIKAGFFREKVHV